MRKTLTKLANALTALVSTAYAQQDPQFTQFMHNRLAYNPAYAGTSGAICFGGMYRQQWVNFPGAPKTGLFTFDMPIASTFGVGLYLANDQLGYDNTTLARASFAFHRNLGANGAGKFSVALDAGILQKKINGNWVAPQTLNDPSIPNNQSVTGAPALNKLVPDFGFGLYYTIPGKMYAGFSTSHIAAQDLKGASGSNGPGQTYNLNFSLARHYYVIAGYTFQLSNTGGHELTPNVKVKSDGASTQLDINLTYMFQKKFWLGASYRMQDAVAPMLGYVQNMGKSGSLKIGYSYDVTTSKIKGYSSGTHEIMLGYCLAPKDPNKISSHGNVRFLED